MVNWKEFETFNPKLAQFGKERLKSGVAYLATVRKDGSPRVHPVTPIISQERIFLFMEPFSPKGFDLKRNGHYAIHSDVKDVDGGNGEFRLKGIANLVEDANLRKEAIESSSYKPQDRYILFELSVEEAGSTIYIDGKPSYLNWKKNSEK